MEPTAPLSVGNTQTGKKSLSASPGVGKTSAGSRPQAEVAVLKGKSPCYGMGRDGGVEGCRVLELTTPQVLLRYTLTTFLFDGCLGVCCPVAQLLGPIYIILYESSSAASMWLWPGSPGSHHDHCPRFLCKPRPCCPSLAVPPGCKRRPCPPSQWLCLGLGSCCPLATFPRYPGSAYPCHFCGCLGKWGSECTTEVQFSL